MSRRQALGLLTNQRVNNNENLIKQTTTTTTTTTTLFSKTTIVNDENVYQQQHQAYQQKNSFQTLKPQVSTECFDVFQDDEQIPIYCDSSARKESDCEMGRLLNQIKKQPLQSIPLNLLDTSKDSPMVLDDTIKFLTKSDDAGLDFSDEEENLDLEDDEAQERENILMNCEEYSKDILEHLRQLELINRPKASYIRQQQDISSTMRSILVDWLVEVSEEYKLHTETLYLAVNYTDRFLSKMSVLRGKLQLLGTASMYIASKYEEIFPPDAAEFVYITDDTYTKQQVLRMEHLVLKVLNFHMNAPTANCFLLHYLRFAKLTNKVEHLARYLAELTLIEADPFLEYLPSQIAASALYLSMYKLNKKWTNEHTQLVGYSVDELRKCIEDVYKCWTEAPAHPQQAIQEKYKQEKFQYVANLDVPTELIIS